MAATCHLYDEVAYESDLRKRYGLVVETLSSDDEVDDEDIDISNRRRKGLLRVAWHPNGEEEVLPHEKVQLVNHPLRAGQVVSRRGEGGESQRGFVMDVTVKCDLLVIGHHNIISGVDSRQLECIKAWNPQFGYVCLNSWVGKIESVKEVITLSFSDGARCTIDTDDKQWSFEDSLHPRLHDSKVFMNVFYAGQQLTGTLGSLTGASWTKPTPQFNFEAVKMGGYRDVKVIVEDVITKTVEVNWLCQGFSQCNHQPLELEAPNRVLNESDLLSLKRLDCFESQRAQIGDRAFYKIADDASVENINSKSNYSQFSHLCKGGKDFVSESSNNTSATPEKETVVISPDGNIPKPGDKVVVEVLRTKSTADVVWHTGAVEKGIAATELSPDFTAGSLEFYPLDFVCHADTSESRSSDEYGLVEKVDHIDRTCTVRWMTSPSQSSVEGPIMKSESEEVSVYDIKNHPDYKFDLERIVLRVAQFEGGHEDSDPPVAGQVCELGQNGELLVAWAGGGKTWCSPQALIAIDELLDLTDIEQYTHEDSDSDSSGDESSLGGHMQLKVMQLLELTYNLIEQIQAVEVIDISSYIIDTFPDILEIYHLCRSCDRMMFTSFFKDEALLDAISAVHGEIRAEKTHKVAKQVLNMIRSNSETATSLSQSSDVFGTQASGTSGTEQTATGVFEENAEKWQASSDGALTSANTEEPWSPGILRPKINRISCISVSESDDQIRNQAAKHLSDKACVLLKKKICSVLESVVVKIARSLSESSDKILGDLNLDIPKQGHENAEQAMSDAATPLDECEPLPHDEIQVKDSSQTPDNEADMQDVSTPIVPSNIHLNKQGFEMLDSVPASHKYFSSEFKPVDKNSFLEALSKELELLKSSLPSGITVRGYSDREDLFRVMIEGPTNTPYEDGLFFFDVQLANNHPISPPAVYYTSYCTDQLSPNLQTCGKVFISLLGTVPLQYLDTWPGRGTLFWSHKSTLLQVFTTIRDKVLVKEPFYNETGYEQLRGSERGQKFSHLYNEKTLIKMVQSMTCIVSEPPQGFDAVVLAYLQSNAYRMIQRLQCWVETLPVATGVSSLPPAGTTVKSDVSALPVYPPTFSLAPLSKGFKISLQTRLDNFHLALISAGIKKPDEI